MKSPKA